MKMFDKSQRNLSPIPKGTSPQREQMGPFTLVEQIYTALTFGFNDQNPNIIKLVNHVRSVALNPSDGISRSNHIRTHLRKPNYLVVDPSIATLIPAVLNCLCLTFEYEFVSGVNTEEYQRVPIITLDAAIKNKNPDIVFLKPDEYEESIRTRLAVDHPSITFITVFDPRDNLTAEIANTRTDVMRSQTFIENVLFDAIIAFNMGIERMKLLAK